MKCNEAGIRIIKDFEGCRLEAYLCPAQRWTIGYGHTGADVHPGMMIDAARAEELLRQDLATFETGMASLVKVRVSINQFSALVCFAFNVGLSALAGSTLLRLLNAGDFARAAWQFGRWTHAGQQELPGLVRRRAAEALLFMTPDEET
jgi:lysozyme